MKKSVLVDFYNLELKSVILRRDIKIPNANGEDTIIHEEDVERIIGFFEIHAPQLVKKLTLEEKQRISELYYTRLRKQIVVKGREELTDEEIVQNLARDFSLYNGEPFFNACTTFQGFEEVTGIPWFFSPDYSNFSEHYFKVKMLIDSYLANHVIPKEQVNFLKSKLNTYMDIHSKMDDARKYLNNKDNEIVSAIITSIHTSIPKEMGIFTFPLWGLFDMIYSEMISVLEGKLKIGRCKREDCNNNNIFLKSGSRKYCSDECRREAKRENDRQNQSDKRDTEENHQMLCDLIELWLKLSRNNEWLDECLKEVNYRPKEISMLKNQLKGEGKRISARKLKEALEYLLTDMQEIPVERLKKYLTDRERNYINKYANGKIPFLYDNVSASSLAGLLKEVKEKLRMEKGIRVYVNNKTKSGKKKKWAIYQFMIKR